MLVRQIALNPRSALYRDLSGEMAEWTSDVQLLAMIANDTANMMWLKTEDATRRNPRNRPVPILPPGQKPPDDAPKTFGSDPISLEAMRTWLGWDRERTDHESS